MGNGLKLGVVGLVPNLRNSLIRGVALTVLALAPGALRAEQACNEAMLPQPIDCTRANGQIAVDMPQGENAELVRGKPGRGYGDLGFSISIDAGPVAGAVPPGNPDRPTDLRAAADDIDVRYDGLDPRTYLNVSTFDIRSSYRAGETVGFRASANYPEWIARAEVRILDRDARGRPVVATLPVAPNGSVAWVMPSGGARDFAYVLRVYDKAGRWDETIPLDLSRSAEGLATHETVGEPVTAAGEGEDRTRIRNIPVRGGRVTVSGFGPPGGTVQVMGEPVPVDASGQFVVSRILPSGDRTVTVNAAGRAISRKVRVPEREWFYVGIADLTFGHRFRDDLQSADPDYDKTYVDGRFAGYAKGKTAGGYTITGSIDTGEGPVKDAFKRLSDKDPRRVIERLDPEDLYPTYGDDSTAFDDAPTSGRFYLKVEKGASSLMWGDFKSDITGTEFLRQSRALYGAQLRYVTPQVTAQGDPRARVTLYAAQPDTLPQRDILRGTGGSVYFLSRQDINGGSETIAIETVDPVTGRVVARTILAEGTDYDIDYIQGVVILAQPLGSSASGGGLIGNGNTGSSGQYDVNLVAQYEYTPTAGSLDGASVGGRVEVQATEKLRFGLTAMSESTGSADQKLAGADLRYDIGPQSYVEAEVASSKGPGFSKSFSSDGGLTINAGGVVNAPRALGYRFDSRFEFSDLGWQTKGFVGVYAERKEAGFSTLTEDITADQDLFGINAEIALSDRLTFGADLERFRKTGGDKRDSGELRLSYAIDRTWTVEAAIAALDKFTAADPTETGKRTDAAVRVTWTRDADLKLYGFGQTTLSHSGGVGRNDRLGFGGEARLSEKLTFSGEVSGGAKGLGARARLSYAPSADSEFYFGYTLDPTRSDQGYQLVGRDGGKIVAGTKYKISDAVSTYGEQGWDLFGDRRSLTRTYGVTYTPSDRWTISGGIEAGEVRDRFNGNFDRRALSFGVAYADDEDVKGRLRLEYRTESGNGTVHDRRTWAASGGYEYKVSDDWRFIAGLDALVSRDDTNSFRDGEYVEASLGYAYRPVLNDRLNLLMRYTYLRDLPGADQVSANGLTSGPLQVSHIFSIDGNYDLNPKLTIGAKYGFRSSQVSQRGSGVFTDSTAHLGVLRADWHVVHKWDVLGEVRLLYTQESGDTDHGLLLGAYRHIGNNAKIGIGYEWGKVSDDLAQIDYRSSGVFLNIVGKF
jgi:hypothetical protein